jgi:hypothetical protein
MFNLNDLRVWLSLETPIIEDGNSFGADVQKHIYDHIEKCFGRASQYMNGAKRHHDDRCLAVAKWIQMPNVADYAASIAAVSCPQVSPQIKIRRTDKTSLIESIMSSLGITYETCSSFTLESCPSSKGTGRKSSILKVMVGAVMPCTSQSRSSILVFIVESAYPMHIQ